MLEKWEWDRVRGKMVVRKKCYGSCEREWWRKNKCNGLNLKGNRGGWSFPLVNRGFIHMNGGFWSVPQFIHT